RGEAVRIEPQKLPRRSLVARAADEARLSAIMRHKQLFGRDSGPLISAGGISRVDDEAEAVPTPRRPPQQGPDHGQIVGPRPVMIDSEWQRRTGAHAQHRRNTGIDQVGLADFRVAKDLAKPEQGSHQRLPRPAALALDKPELPLDSEKCPE